MLTVRLAFAVRGVDDKGRIAYESDEESEDDRRALTIFHSMEPE